MWGMDINEALAEGLITQQQYSEILEQIEQSKTDQSNDFEAYMQYKIATGQM
jgi:hypothetical protein